ncbi:sensor histidine kinase [Haloechinothrix salitolerans]|uniref:histidine kinase n=1 Tax=Haloechinothrix salitolerans TaxID=926830 RepID=A0ABW2C7W9_9PSEU
MSQVFSDQASATVVNSDPEATITIVISLIAAAVRADDAAFLDVPATPNVPIRVVAGSIPSGDLTWLREKGHLNNEDGTYVRLQTRPPRLARFMVLQIRGRAGAMLVTRHERGTRLNADERRVTVLIRDCLELWLEAERSAGALSASLIMSEELFRTRLAADLHDDVGQRLSALLIEAKRLQKTTGQMHAESQYETASWIFEQLQECNAVVRELVYENSTTALIEFGICAAVRDLTERVQARNDLEIECSFGVAGGGYDLSYNDVPHSIQVACFRIIQEAITNVVKHAEARHCVITLTLNASWLSATIADDGCGFLATTTTRDGFGLAGMRQRTEMLDGRISINNNQPSGTTIQVDLPLTFASE